MTRMRVRRRVSKSMHLRVTTTTSTFVSGGMWPSRTGRTTDQPVTPRRRYRRTQQRPAAGTTLGAVKGSTRQTTQRPLDGSLNGSASGEGRGEPLHPDVLSDARDVSNAQRRSAKLFTGLGSRSTAPDVAIAMSVLVSGGRSPPYIAPMIRLSRASDSVASSTVIVIGGLIRRTFWASGPRMWIPSLPGSPR